MVSFYCLVYVYKLDQRFIFSTYSADQFCNFYLFLGIGDKYGIFNSKFFITILDLLLWTSLKVWLLCHLPEVVFILNVLFVPINYSTSKFVMYVFDFGEMKVSFHFFLRIVFFSYKMLTCTSRVEQWEMFLGMWYLNKILYRLIFYQLSFVERISCVYCK